MDWDDESQYSELQQMKKMRTMAWSLAKVSILDYTNQHTNLLIDQKTYSLHQLKSTAAESFQDDTTKRTTQALWSTSLSGRFYSVELNL